MAKEIDRCLSELGAKRFVSTELADENTPTSIYGGKDQFDLKIEKYWLVNSGLEGHYAKWSSQLKSAFQTPKTEKCDCSNDKSTTCCQSTTNGVDHAVEVRRNLFIGILNCRLF